MIINYIKYLKNQITVSYKGGSTLSGLEDIHTTKNPDTYSSLWGSPDTTASHWIKLNVYQLFPLSRFIIRYLGTYDDILVETSLDDLNWEEVLTYSYSDDNNEIDLELTNFQFFDFTFIKFTVSNPSSFVMTELAVYGNVDYTNDNYISHFHVNYYGNKFRSDYPLFPDIAEQELKMWESTDDIDETLFDPADYDSSAITKVNEVGNAFGLSASGFPIDTDVIYYIWDFDDPQDEFTDEDRTIANPAYDVDNPNVVITTDISDIPTHDYDDSADGIYVPRLIIKKENYMLEFTEYFVKSP